MYDNDGNDVDDDDDDEEEAKQQQRYAVSWPSCEKYVFNCIPNFAVKYIIMVLLVEIRRVYVCVCVCDGEKGRWKEQEGLK